MLSTGCWLLRWVLSAWAKIKNEHILGKCSWTTLWRLLGCVASYGSACHWTNWRNLFGPNAQSTSPQISYPWRLQRRPTLPLPFWPQPAPHWIPNVRSDDYVLRSNDKVLSTCPLTSSIGKHKEQWVHSTEYITLIPVYYAQSTECIALST